MGFTMRTALIFSVLRRVIASFAFSVCVLVAAVVFFKSGSLPASEISLSQTEESEEYSLLDGAIDLHLHIDPDTPVGQVDAIDIEGMKFAKAQGMRGFVIKNHRETTASVAYLVRKEVPGIEVFGGIALNLIQGGINLDAVEYLATGIRGKPFRFVWMPTRDSEHSARRSDVAGTRFVKVSQGCDDQGCIDAEVLPEVSEMIGLIAEHDLVLATGHLSPEESLLVLQEANRQGVKHMIVTHPMISSITWSEAQMREAVELGAFLEFDYRVLMAERGETDMIRAIGPEHVVIDEFWTGSGSYGTGGTREYGKADGLSEWVKEMNARGFSNDELDMMVKDNPAILLGLPPR